MIDHEGAAPHVADVPDPEGEGVAEVLAAPINPIDLATAAGRFTVPATYPYVAGKEGVGRVEGELAYFMTGGGHGPGGSMSERTPVGETIPIGHDVDHVAAACLGIAGLAAWLALDWRGGIREGENVLVLGAGGAVGQIAVQAARLLGAGRVVAAARSGAGLEKAAGRGADETVRIEEEPDFAEVAGEGFDLIVDPLWGKPAEAAARVAAREARLVQIGRSAGETATFASADVRGKQMSILGHQNFSAPYDVRAAAFARMVEALATGDLLVEYETYPLERAPQAWREQAEHPGRKLVVVL